MGKIIKDDCFNFFKTLENKSIDHVFTSPPYNRKRNDKYKHYDDNIEDYFGFLCNAINESLRVSKGYVIFNLQKNYYCKRDIYKLIGYFEDKIQEVIIWEKSNPLPASGLSITNAYEFFIVFGSKPLKSNFTYTKNHITTSVNSNMPKEHKAVMKQDVSDWFIKNFTQKKDLILDPFAGLGTTAKSCLKYERDFIMIEKTEEYYKYMKQNIYGKN